MLGASPLTRYTKYYLMLTIEYRASSDLRNQRLRPAPQEPRSQSCKVM